MDGWQRSGRFGRTLISLEVLLAIGGFAGGVRLITAQESAMPIEWLEGTPFSSWLWPGVALFVINGLWPTAVAIGASLGRAFAHPGHMLVGIGLAGWVVVQLAVIGYVSWMQPAYLSLGLLLLGLGFANYRSWHLRWGTTEPEVRQGLPGDDLIESPHFAPTRAITIDAAPHEVWPWIVQMGFGRAGWYSYDLLDNFGRPSASAVVPTLQHIEIGDWVSMAPKPNETNAFRIYAFWTDELMVWSKPDSTWVWKLRSLPGGRTRLITRVRVRYQAGWMLVLSLILMELGDFPMMRRCLLGIKQRAEQRKPIPQPSRSKSGR